MRLINNHKKFFLILCLSLFILTACQQNKTEGVNNEDLLSASIEVMKNVDSYVADTRVGLVDQEGVLTDQLMATITYHNSPFSYSNLQEMQASSNDAGIVDDLQLYLLVKDDVAYIYNSITGIWLDDEDDKLIGSIKELSNIFGSFESNYFIDLENVETKDNRVTIRGNTNSSAFLHNLMQAIDAEATGAFETVIDENTNFMESFHYTVDIESEGKMTKHQIDISLKSINNAPEIEIPESALY
ncbi:hypothetical protein [Alkaliphilus peptidifermentans]|uniref:LppX_LprAFG lipoprotein n=1 Tax=Alkaliphilus peptidifermentans DSM 18978 TaxID=1120976 RepID=A0A1G5ICT1_9FIRM|nr:hypothetical protein [Alkaliphilus peptidifermentans]SCY73727.1 hypothetical protein SAMN03080606_02341 [Alkaliphilus peptidifermentans DSM 18978]